MGADEHRAPIEPVFRLAETEFKLFIEKLTDLFPEVDPQIPPLPPKDVIYRIYRDVRPTLFWESWHLPETAQIRFSNDKTPYKTNLSATFSRSGRKGTFAGCKYLYASMYSLPPNNIPSFRPYVRSFCVLLYLMEVSLSFTHLTLQNE